MQYPQLRLSKRKSPILGQKRHGNLSISSPCIDHPSQKPRRNLWCGTTGGDFGRCVFASVSDMELSGRTGWMDSSCYNDEWKKRPHFFPLCSFPSFYRIQSALDSKRCIYAKYITHPFLLFLETHPLEPAAAGHPRPRRSSGSRTRHLHEQRDLGNAKLAVPSCVTGQAMSSSLLAQCAGSECMQVPHSHAGDLVCWLGTPHGVACMPVVGFALYALCAMFTTGGFLAHLQGLLNATPAAGYT